MAGVEPMRRWERKTLEILKQHVSPDEAFAGGFAWNRRSSVSRCCRRGTAAPSCALSGHLPGLRPSWRTQQPKREGTVQVYLDVSGSMSAEMPVVIALLGRLSRYIRRPFWAFSDEVAPAIIEHGQPWPRPRVGRAWPASLRPCGADPPCIGRGRDRRLYRKSRPGGVS